MGWCELRPFAIVIVRDHDPRGSPDFWLVWDIYVQGRGTGSLQDKRKGVATKKKLIGQVVAHYKDTDTSNVKKEFTTFANMEFCVLDVAKPHTKAEIETEIVRHGGTKTQQYMDDTRFIVGADPNKGKVGLYISAQKKHHDILV